MAQILGDLDASLGHVNPSTCRSVEKLTDTSGYSIPVLAMILAVLMLAAGGGAAAAVAATAAATATYAAAFATATATAPTAAAPATVTAAQKHAGTYVAGARFMHPSRNSHNESPENAAAATAAACASLSHESFSS